MSRLAPLPPGHAPELKPHFDFFLGTLGFTPNSVLTMQRKPAMRQNKQGINRCYDMRGFLANLDYGAELFALTSMNVSPEGAEFRKIAREQGLKAALRWRDARFE